jgi:hypothetical protein
MSDYVPKSKYPKLDRNTTFEIWLRKVKMVLVDKSPQGASFEDVLLEDDGLIANNRKKARNLVLECVSDEDLMAVFDIVSVPEIIQHLKAKYVGNIKSKAKSLLSQFGKLKLERGQSVSALVEKALDLGRQLTTVRQPQSETAVAMAILNAMPAEYTNTVDRLIDGGDADEDLTVERVRTSLLMKENQLAEGAPPKQETKALMAVEARVGDKRPGSDGYYDGVCYKCGFPTGPNHWSRSCKNKRIKPGFVPKYGYQSTGGGGDRARGRGGRPGGRFGGRGPGGRPHQPKVHAVHEEAHVAPHQPQDTITLTHEQLARMIYRGDGPSPHVAYVGRPAADRSGEPTPTELAEMQRCILDSGAGISCTPLKHALTEFTPFSRSVACANDTSMPAHGSGTLTATSHSGNAMGVELSDVWYVPACKHTLISVKALQRKGCWALIKDNWIQYYNARNQKLFLAVETELGFEIQWDLHVPVKHIPVNLHAPGSTVHHTTVKHYVLQSEHKPLPFFSDTDMFDICESPVETQEAEGERVHVQYINSHADNALLLHARTGHMTLATLATMVKEGHITGVNVTSTQLLQAAKHTCGICAQAKLARTPFKASQRVTTRNLELVHCDLVEFPVASLGGGKYVLVVTDDYSKWCGVKILKSKAHAKDELQAMLNQWMTLTGEQVHTLRTDRGGEFVNADMLGYLAEKGIIHQQSIAYEHQQNGKAERANRTLTNIVRALLLQAKFPDYMWAEAMQLACHLRNLEYRVKTQATPHFMFLGTVPDVSALRVFGCQVYYRVPEELRKKLDPRSKPGFYLGPEPNSKGHRILTKTATGQLTVKAVRDIVSVEKYMIHAVPSLQSYEHIQAGPAAPGVSPEVPLIDGPEAPPASQEELLRRGPEEPRMSPGVPSSLPSPEVLTDTPQSEWEAAMLSQLSDMQQAGRSETAAAQDGGGTTSNLKLPTPEEVYDSQNRRSERARSQPVRYGDWNGSSVNWVKEVILTLDSSDIGQAVSDTVWTQLVQDAVNVTDQWVAADLESCEWASGSGPQVLAVNESAAQTPASDPLTIEDAFGRPDGDRWHAATDSEVDSLLKNNTWELVKREDWMKVLPCKWVLKVKTDSQGLPDRYKARLVVGGHRQVYGVDFDETFASVSKGTTQRALISLAAHFRWTVRQMDISTAFLHGEIDHEIYMQQPEGYDFGDGLVCKLTKCLYGLKQAPRAWFAKLTDFLREIGFRASTADPNLWFGDWKGVKVWIAIVVDDTLLTSCDTRATVAVEREILKRFPGKSGQAEWYCGMKLDWQSDGSVRITQTAHIEQLLARHHLQNIHTRSVPMGTATKLTGAGDPLDTRQFPFASIVGALLYIACNTRPDIASTVNKLTKYMSKPTTEHWKLLLDLLGYLKGTSHMGLHLGRSERTIGFCDSDFASCLDTRRSHTGWVFQLFGGPICWQSKCQSTVATSTVEAEYQAASAAAREALWLRQLFADLDIPQTPMVILCDSQGALSAMMNSQISQRVKHIDIIHHFVRERCQLGQIKFQFVEGKLNVADVLTKPVPKDKHIWCCQHMGMW